MNRKKTTPESSTPLLGVNTRMGRVPQDASDRRRLERAAVEVVAATGPDHQRALDAEWLKELARRTLSVGNWPEEYLAFAMICVNNAFWEEAFSRVDYSRRVLLLPHCPRDQARCQGHYDRNGLDCKQCGSCPLGDFKREAETLGYRTVIAEGTPVVLRLLIQDKVDAALGVACLEVLSKAFGRVRAAGAPSLAVPLLSDGCLETKIDAERLRTLMHLRQENYGGPARGFLALLREADRLVARDAASLAGSLLPDSPPGGVGSIALEWLKTGGKRFRPFITLAAYRAVARGEAKSGEASLPLGLRRAALAIEAFHKASLVHDDIEDDDPLRYGQPTVHAEHGIPMAVNVGDFLIGLGYGLVGLAASDIGAAAALDIQQRLARAHLQLAEGQGRELTWRQNRRILPAAETLEIYALKTTPAFEAALYAGLRAAEPLDETLDAQVAAFSRHLGVGYQALDDLDDWSPERAEGEELGGDLRKAPILLASLAQEAENLPASRRETLSSLITGPHQSPAIQKLALKIFQESGAFEAAAELVRACRERALKICREVHSPSLGQALRYLVEAILEEPSSPSRRRN